MSLINSMPYGGAGECEELPLLPSYEVNTGDSGQIKVLLNNPARAFAGNMFVYKQGNTAPVNSKDGVKVDLGKNTAQIVSGLSNDVRYMGRVFPYNSKKQLQTIYNEQTFVPSGYKPGLYELTREGILKKLDFSAKLTEPLWQVDLKTLGAVLNGPSVVAYITGFDKLGNIIVQIGLSTANSSAKAIKFSPNGDMLKTLTGINNANGTSSTMRLTCMQDGLFYLSEPQQNTTNLNVKKYSENFELISNTNYNSISFGNYIEEDRPFIFGGDSGIGAYMITDFVGNGYVASRHTGGNCYYVTKFNKANGLKEFTLEANSLHSFFFSPDNTFFIAREYSNTTTLTGDWQAYDMSGKMISIPGIEACMNVRLGRSTDDLVTYTQVKNGTIYTATIQLISISKSGVTVKRTWSSNSDENSNFTPQTCNLFRNDYNSGIYVAYHSYGPSGYRMRFDTTGSTHTNVSYSASTQLMAF